MRQIGRLVAGSLQHTGKDCCERSRAEGIGDGSAALLHAEIFGVPHGDGRLADNIAAQRQRNAEQRRADVKRNERMVQANDQERTAKADCTEDCNDLHRKLLRQIQRADQKVTGGQNARHDRKEQ